MAIEIQKWQTNPNRFKYDQLLAICGINNKWLPYGSEKEGIDKDLALSHVLALPRTTETPAWFNSLCTSYLVCEWYKEEGVDKYLEMFPLPKSSPMETLETIYGSLNCESKVIN